MATVAMSCGNKLLIRNLIPDNTKYKLNFWLVKTLLSYYFQTLLPPEVIFTSSENVFFSKSFIPSSGNLFSFQWKQYALVGRLFSAVGSHKLNQRESFLTEKYFHTSGNHFRFFCARRSSFFVQWKPFSIFCARRSSFFCQWKPFLIFLPKEAGFFASGIHFRFYFCEKKQFFRIVETIFDLFARKSSFLYSGFHQQKKLFLAKKIENGFHQQKRLLLLPKKYRRWVPLAEKASSGKKIENGFHQQKKLLLTKIMENVFHQQKKLLLLAKKIENGFLQQKNLLFLAKKIKNDYHQHKKLLRLAKKKSKMVSTIRKNRFFFCKKKQFFHIVEMDF